MSPYADTIILTNDGPEKHLSTSILTMSCSQFHGLLAHHYFWKHITNKFLPSYLTPLWIAEYSQKMILHEANGTDLHSGSFINFTIQISVIVVSLKIGNHFSFNFWEEITTFPYSYSWKRPTRFCSTCSSNKKDLIIPLWTYISE